MEVSGYRPALGWQQGNAAETIQAAEVALAQQNSANSQLDMQVISAVMNAHLTAVEGREELDKLQQEIEAAIRTRSDLDTPAGARDFQRFLIGKLRDIRAVVANASLDNTSKSALMAAWTSLYAASQSGLSVSNEQSPPSAPAAVSPEMAPDSDFDPLLFDEPGLPTADLPSTPAPLPSPMAPLLPSVPSVGGGMGCIPSGNPLSELFDRNRADPAEKVFDRDQLESAEKKFNDYESTDEPGKPHEDTEPAAGQPDPSSTTTVPLPDGEVVTAATPQLAAAIKAAVDGVLIAEAFRQQGMAIPEPGTAVVHSIEPSELIAGDIGILTDRHALALGHGKALLDGQIQYVAAMNSPDFLGWQHPPASTAATSSASAGQPTPTRPAVAPMAMQ